MYKKIIINKDKKLSSILLMYYLRKLKLYLGFNLFKLQIGNSN